MLGRVSVIGMSLLLLSCSGDTDAPAPVAAPAGGGQSEAPVLQRKPAPEGAVAYIIEPVDGAIVDNPVRVVFGLRGAGVIPAGFANEGAGHHHLLIDASLPDLSLPIPNDDNHRHFGGGQTETELTLASGEHTLQLLLGDELHVPHEPAIASDVVTIEVR
jgi:hypothetical protein